VYWFWLINYWSIGAIMSYIKNNEDNSVYKFFSDNSYTEPDKLLCKLKDTGNGYIFKFPSWSSSRQDNYICLDYAEAYYVYKMLEKHHLLTNALRE